MRNEVFEQFNDLPIQKATVDIPIELVPLPSRGLVYPEDHPLHGKEEVEIKAMTAKEEDILMSPALIKKGTVITELIKSCLIDKKINPQDLLVGDRNAIMIAIRITGYGKDYEVSYECPSCETKNNLTIDLTELNIKHLDIEPIEPFKNAFLFELPKSKKKVVFKFMSGKEEEELLAESESKKKKGILVGSLVTSKLIKTIVSVDGNTDRGVISKFVTNMPAIDSLELRKFIDEHEPGVDMKIDFTCQSCGHSDRIQMPIGSTFFWPNTK